MNSQPRWAATRLKSGDERARSLLAAARQAKADADRAHYVQVLTDAKTAMFTKRYRDAVRLAYARGQLDGFGDQQSLRLQGAREEAFLELRIENTLV